MIVYIGLSVLIAIIITIPWVNALDKDLGEYEYCIGCTEVECNECPKTDGCGKAKRQGTVL